MVIHSPIILGSDRTLLQLSNMDTEADPSGFFVCGFDSVSVETILTIASDAWSDILKSIPKNISISLPQSISLYMEHSQKQESPSGSLRYRFDRSLAKIDKHQNDMGWKISIKEYPIPEIRGIVLSLTPEMLSSHVDDLYEILVHEMLHLLSHCALASSHMIAEAFVERMSQCILPHRASRELRHLPWRLPKFSGTCGLKIDDFSEVHQNSAFQNLVTIHALNSFTDISCETMWDIVASLLQQAGESKFCPSSLDILQAIKLAIDDVATKHILESTTMRPLNEGKQCFFCPFGKGELFAFCVAIKKNTDHLYAPLEKPLAWDKHQFFIDEASTKLILEMEYKNGDRSIFDICLNGELQLSFKKLLSISPQAKKPILENDVRVIHCEALGIKTSLIGPAEE